MGDESIHDRMAWVPWYGRFTWLAVGFQKRWSGLATV